VSNRGTSASARAVEDYGAVGDVRGQNLMGAIIANAAPLDNIVLRSLSRGVLGQRDIHNFVRSQTRCRHARRNYQAYLLL